MKDKLKVVNLPRGASATWPHTPNKHAGMVERVYPLIGDDTIWISIGEPDPGFKRTENLVLDSKPNLKLEFWDLDKPLEYGDETLNPPSMQDAALIVEFILDNPGKNIIVNCAAGISRSGAVCLFCEDILGYEWIEEGKKRATPNVTLYRHMVNHYRGVAQLPFA